MIETIIDEIKVFLINNKKKLLIFGFPIVLIIIFLIVFPWKVQKEIKEDNYKISNFSENIQTDEISFFNLSTSTGYLFKSKSTGVDAALDFIRQNPEINGQKLFTENLDKNSQISRSAKDNEDQFLKARKINIDNEHYFFNQKINNIPVFNGNFSVHLKNKNEVYSTSGNLIRNTEVRKRVLSNDQAISIASLEAKKENIEEASLKVKNIEVFIFNKKIIGLAEDETNYLTLAVNLEALDSNPPINSIYFIDLTDGSLIYTENLVQQSLDRNIFDCRSGACSLSRNEGANPIGENYVDSLYDILGETYNYFLNNFNRDSIDGNGNTLNGKVKPPCRNASWDGTYMNICEDAFGKDVIAHELTHGVTQHTANLTYSYQSGALNESMSDIFASDVDGNWTMGEGTGLGIIRDLSNPPAKSQPDKLFSSYYHCATSDNGGVHRNSGVLNKAYYLISDGGSFNGCSVSGIGRSKASAVIYYSLTRYLSNSSNFRSVYSAGLQSCTDLYGESVDCEEVKKALQSVELDQQPSMQQEGAMCTSISEQTPECAGGAPLPTDVLTPVPSGVLTPTVSKSPSQNNLPLIKVFVYWDKNNNNLADSGEEYQGAKINISGPYIGESLTDLKGESIFTKLPLGDYKISFEVLTVRREIPDSIKIDSEGVQFTQVIEISGSEKFPTTAPTNPPSSPAPTSGSGGGSTGGGRITPTPTPTSYIIGDCVMDSNCFKSETLQLCTLKCSPK